MKNRLWLLLASIVLLAAFVMVLPHSLRAQSGNQWRADYFANPDWTGSPVYSQFTNLIGFNWGLGSPAPNIPADNFTGRFTTNAFFYSGMYRFSILADDEFVFVVDGTVYVDTRGSGMSGKTVVVDVPMTQGNHFIQVDYRELILNAYVYVDWQYLKPGGGQPPGVVPTPTRSPSSPYPNVPASAPSVQTRYGDFTPCIRGGQHQAACYRSDGAWDAPNLGSIQMEPQIQVWGNCEPPDSDQTWTTDPNADPPIVKDFRCSKTLAGWFPK